MAQPTKKKYLQAPDVHLKENFTSVGDKGYTLIAQDFKFIFNY